MSEQVVSTSRDVMGGTPVFPGTRVPVQTLLDYIEAGDSIDEFLRGFPTVTRDQVVAFLERAAASVASNTSAASPHATTSRPADSLLSSRWSPL